MDPNSLDLNALPEDPYELHRLWEQVSSVAGAMQHVLSQYEGWEHFALSVPDDEEETQ